MRALQQALVGRADADSYKTPFDVMDLYSC